MEGNPSIPWNHTTHYHGILLEAVPTPCPRALDVGCGEGFFARQLSTLVDRVDAVDVAGEVLTRAQTLSNNIQNLRWIEADFMSYPFEPSSYSFVSMLATLHHLPLGSAIEKMKGLLRPGGVFGVVGLYHPRTLTDYLLSAVAVPVSRFYRMTRGIASVNAPICTPVLTLQEILTETMRLLPGAIFQRHLLWRYSIVWKKPLASETSVII